MDQLIKQLKSLSKKNSNIILAGDFNVIPAAEDVYNVKSFEDDALYRLEIRKKFREMLNLGFSDVYRHFNEDKEGYTFWDYMRGAWQKNNGMRIDHFLVSSSIVDNIKDININKDPRGREKPSDHTPIEINLDLKILILLTNSSLIFLGLLSNLFLCLLSPGSLTSPIDFILSKNSSACFCQSVPDVLSGLIAK